MKTGLETSRIGALVGAKYRIVRLLAKGGMGVVFEAQHTVVRRRFAIKLLRAEFAQRRDILTRFQREAEAAGTLESENIAEVVDFGIADDGTPYIVMEYLVGENLASLIEREGKLSVSRATDLVSQACRGVQAAHATGIVHRDLKPENLFVCRREDGTDLLKVLDFGVAKLQSIDEISATRTGAILGTIPYMSPEQARGDKEIDKRTDVYALGAILYELLSLKRPHPGDSHNAILHHISTHPAVPLDAVEPNLPPALVELIGRALSSDPAARPASADDLTQAVAPFVGRQVWPAPPNEDSRARGRAQTSTVLAPRNSGLATPGEASQPPSIEPAQPIVRRRGRARIAMACGLALATIAVVSASFRHTAAPSPPGRPVPRARARIDPDARFLKADPQPAAVQQIEGLLTARAYRDAALLNAILATPSSFHFEGGSPQQVQSDVRGIVARGGRQGRVPVLMARNHPFRDCSGYGTSEPDTRAYEAWIDGFAAGIGNETAVVLLEPESLGNIPYGVRIDGSADPCRPTVADAEGRRVRPPNATPTERFAQINYALDSLASKAPNAVVYLDGTHSGWLTVGDAAYRLTKAGVGRAAGFCLNNGNYQPTPRMIQYGTWVAKCIYYSSLSAGGVDEAETKPFRECASPPAWADPSDDRIWSEVDAWYVRNVDLSPRPPPGPGTLAHFVINTNRNGRGPLVAARYAEPPYNQPPAVVEALRNGAWCMPPDRGLGLRPTADTRVPLVDAYLWTDPPGTSAASCDIAGGARAWDYSRYNPWGIAGDAQNHFDPLWGMVVPPAGAWFPESALQLARNSNPPLVSTRIGRHRP
jgi:endoglucanase